MKNQCTGLFKFEEFDSVFLKEMESICKNIEQGGLDPYSQLTGYLMTGNDHYITRIGGARTTIASLEKEKIQAYIKLFLEK